MFDPSEERWSIQRPTDQEIEKFIQEEIEPLDVQDTVYSEVQKCDLDTLKGEHWLSDDVIDNYLSLVEERSIFTRNYPLVGNFGPKFFQFLEAANWQGQDLAEALCELESENIFAKTIILIPVFKQGHWSLIVVYVNLKDILITFYDSVGDSGTPQMELIMKFLSAKHLKQFGTELREGSIRIQANEEGIPKLSKAADSGVFICLCAEHVSRKAPMKFSQVILNELFD